MVIVGVTNSFTILLPKYRSFGVGLMKREMNKGSYYGLRPDEKSKGQNTRNFWEIKLGNIVRNPNEYHSFISMKHP